MYAHTSILRHLTTPLYRRGRPKSVRSTTIKQRSHTSHQHSNLAILHQQNKITTDQYNAGETFLWILAQARKHLPLPKMSQVKYQEKIVGVFHKEDLKNEDFIKKIFQKWYQSIEALKQNGSLTKELLEDFVWYNDKPVEALSPVELQLIKRGLDVLIPIYHA